MEVRAGAGTGISVGRGAFNKVYEIGCMKTINLTIPEYLNYDETEWKIILAGELYERGKLSVGQAADLAGFSKRAFIELMGKYGFSVFSDSLEDLKSDIKNA